MKGNEIIYDRETIDKQHQNQSYCQKRMYVQKEQLLTLSEIIRKERKIDFHFDGSLRKFELKSIVDNENKSIEIDEFIMKNN